MIYSHDILPNELWYIIISKSFSSRLFKNKKNVSLIPFVCRLFYEISQLVKSNYFYVKLIQYPSINLQNFGQISNKEKYLLIKHELEKNNALTTQIDKIFDDLFNESVGESFKQITFLIEGGLNLDNLSSKLSPLHYFGEVCNQFNKIKNVNDSEIQRIQKYIINLFKLLLDYGANPNQIGDYSTPLLKILSVELGNRHTVILIKKLLKLLLNYGANPHLAPLKRNQPGFQLTPYEFAESNQLEFVVNLFNSEQKSSKS